MLSGGATVPQVEASLATSPEAQGDINALYLSVLGRPTDPGGLASATQALANGTSLAGLRADLAASPEAQADIEGIYRSVLGRTADPGGLANAINTLAGGASLASLRTDVAASPEAQADLQGLYQSVLGRAADAGGLATFTQVLADGGSLSAVQTDLANSAEAAGDITAAFVSSTGAAPDAAQLAGARSLLASGVSLASTETDTASAGELPKVFGPYGAGGYTVAVRPETLGLASIYGLLNDSTLIASRPEAVQITVNPFAAVGEGAAIYGFNPAADILQIDTRAVSSFSALSYVTLGSGTLINLGAAQGALEANSIYLDNVASTSLSTANFRFV